MGVLDLKIEDNKGGRSMNVIFPILGAVLTKIIVREVMGEVSFVVSVVSAGLGAALGYGVYVIYMKIKGERTEEEKEISS
jgi:hypothetical protein